MISVKIVKNQLKMAISDHSQSETSKKYTETSSYGSFKLF